MSVSSKFGLSWILTNTLVRWACCHKLPLGYCVVICLPRIHFEPGSSITARHNHYDHHRWLLLEQVYGKRSGQGKGEHTTTQVSRDRATKTVSRLNTSVWPSRSTVVHNGRWRRAVSTVYTVGRVMREVNDQEMQVEVLMHMTKTKNQFDRDEEKTGQCIMSGLLK